MMDRSKRPQATPWPLWMLTAALTVSFSTVAAQQALYEGSISSFREAREERLRTDYGWLSVIDLHWIESGTTTLGTDASAGLRVPGDTALARIGRIHFEAGKVSLDLEKTAGATRRKVSIYGLDEWLVGADGQFYVGPLQFTLLQRGDRFGVRIKDPRHIPSRGFTGLSHYPIDLSWKIAARLIRYAEPRTVIIDTIIETPAELLSLGTVEFSMAGELFQMEALVLTPDDAEIFIIFKDPTNGKTTYDAGRYLYARILPGDRIDLDFNRAYNPPCAFTSFATCPLPPPQNRLTLEVLAGERFKGLSPNSLRRSGSGG